MADVLQSRLELVVRRAPALMRVLDAVRQLALPDPLVFGGAVCQTVWNDLTGRPVSYGIKDYDIGYFDADTSPAAEDLARRRVASALEDPLRGQVDVANQARVHLWFPEAFGHPYEPLARTAQALERFVCPAFAVGVRLEDNDDIAIAAVARPIPTIGSGGVAALGGLLALLGALALRSTALLRRRKYPV